MEQFDLKYLTAPAVETIRVADLGEAVIQARRRLLFHDPGFGIAICREGQELSRVVQGPKRRRPVVGDGEAH